MSVSSVKFSLILYGLARDSKMDRAAAPELPRPSQAARLDCPDYSAR